jgi:hypothetical protein
VGSMAVAVGVGRCRMNHKLSWFSIWKLYIEFNRLARQQFKAIMTVTEIEPQLEIFLFANVLYTTII